ncbi:hypothetical protein L226DRAFT_468866 [Lentinus tigrinus ALCF2SS1-7]|uniref:Uncharacterized protein n=1 Tax=Lentinus tigrinus ALCF2SS1-6 TaxID=1328759 RepID=A0A5C2RX51_9APHY|nr:hypothetical protein L227DRAFT_510147 [Lentinus tigrinus ALCF2SS1-6]RPD71339.1 hypothetical protein L226DRAFT_468866 [Lentinus tigrinus ALCF2SS1-7]
MKYSRPTPYRSAAPPRSPGPPPDEPLPPLPPPLALDDNTSESKIEPSWALDAIRYSTILGSYTLTSNDLKLLKKVPRGDYEEDGHLDRRITRTQSQILSGHGQRIDFGFCSGGRLKHRGMPMYALSNASEEELYRNMSASGTTVMKPFPLRQIRVRFLWPLPRGSEPSHEVYDEWVRVDPSYTRVQVAMAVARVFYRFVESNRLYLSQYHDYPWRLRPDAFYRVWLVGLERVENNVFVADLKYVKDYPNE